MATDIPSNVNELWERGLEEKKQGNKEEAMKHFIGYYDMLNIFLQSLNIPFSQELIRKQHTKVEGDLREILLDENYLQTTKIPKEGIAEIKAAVGLTEQEKTQVYNRYDLLEASVFVKRTNIGSLEVEQLTLVEYREKNTPKERLLKMELSCEGRTAEFVYDRVKDNPILLQTIAQRILESTGANFNQRTVGDSKIVIQTNYPP